ncbi:MAG: glycosyl hydrolase family 18 protein [Patescibacteria group bacterium]|nr:glycosyl hydrolase family 18 protein [Patescibacteria group bacterium]
MKKTILSIVIFLAALLLLAYFYKDKRNNPGVISPESKLTIIPSVAINSGQRMEKSVFVPYWAMKNDLNFDDFDEIIYFGITANTNGIDKNDRGYKLINEFMNKADQDKLKLLTVRLTNSRINSGILNNTELQKKIINESLDVAKNNGFNGIVLDFEISSLYFDSVVRNINNFSKDFYKRSKDNNLKYYLTVYGDNFYRLRPFDVSMLSENADKIMIMAYDFHKSRGNPGPNFPLDGKQTYGYDFKTMTNDFINKIPKSKIIIVFGFFGYDWTVNGKGESVNSGIPLSMNEVKNKFTKKCAFKECKLQRDNLSFESKITYEDSDGGKHVVWFEDLESVNKKIEFLKSKDINAISYWAYSYF